MLEDFFSDARAIARHRGNTFGPYIDEFAAEFGAHGYARQSVRFAVFAVSRFGRWLAERNLTVGAISEKTIAEFGGRQRYPSYTRHGGPAALRVLLQRLRSQGVAARAVPRAESGPAERLGREFGRYLHEERCLSEATVLNYCPVARLFISERFGTGIIDLSKLCASDIHAFVLRHARHYCTKRVQLMLSGLRRSLRFLYLRAEISSRLADHVPTAPRWRQTQPPKWLSADDIQRVLDSCDRHSATGRRDYAILLLLARLGLRAGEVASLELEDIRWATGELMVRGKGQQRKRFPLAEDVGQALASYLKNARRPGGLRRVFLRIRAPYRGLAGSSTLDAIVRRAVLRAGLDPPCKGAHLFRHSLATSMLRHGATLSQIGQILHHANPNTTSIYAKVDIVGLRGLALPWPGDPL